MKWISKRWNEQRISSIDDALKRRAKALDIQLTPVFLSSTRLTTRQSQFIVDVFLRAFVIPLNFTFTNTLSTHFQHLNIEFFSFLNDHHLDNKRKHALTITWLILAQRTPTSSLSLTNESPRCSTPLYPKQRRTRPFIACDLCRQRAMKDLKTTSTKHNKEKSHPVKQTQFISNSTSTVKMTKTSNIRRRCSALDQLLVWIIWDQFQITSVFSSLVVFHWMNSINWIPLFLYILYIILN